MALRNGDWPFVLRPIGEDAHGLKYQFLGQAYLRGFMQGEAVESVKRGERKITIFRMV